MVHEFDERFPGRAKDQLNCQLGSVTIPRKSFDETLLLDFVERFQGIRSSTPRCGLCTFRSVQENAMVRRKIDLCSLEQQEKYKKNEGYVTQAKRMEKVLAKTMAKL